MDPYRLARYQGALDTIGRALVNVDLSNATFTVPKIEPLPQ